MKKQIIILLILISTVGVYSASAQSRFAPQLGYVAKGDGAVQLGVNGEFFVAERFSIQPAFNYYFLSNIPSGVSHSAWSIDADGHYYFTSDGSVNFYGLLGLSYLHTTVDSFSDSKFGVNLGLGANFGTKSNLLPFLEVKYNSPWEGLVLTAGLRFGGK